MDKRSETSNGESESEQPKSRDSGTVKSRQADRRTGLGQDSKSRSEAARPKPVKLRCVWHTRLIVPAERTVSKTRYQFDAGQVQAVNPLDAPGLLALEHIQPPGCCGNDYNLPALKFFEKT